MSHFDDWDFLFWGDSPTTIAGIVVFCLLLAGVGFYACSADDASARKCAEHGHWHREDLAAIITGLKALRTEKREAV